MRSRQALYQFRQRAFGLCLHCPRPSVDGWRCQRHLEANRTRQRVYKQRARA